MFRSVPIRIALILALSWFIWVILGTWEADSQTARGVESVFSTLCLFLIVGFLAPNRAVWALRIAAGIIGAGYVAYFLSQLASLLHGERQELRVGQPSATMAGFGLLIYAVPCLIFAVSGFPGTRWRSLAGFWRGEPEPEDHDPAA